MMLDGMPYLIAQILLPLGVCLVTGLAAGWFLRAPLTRPRGPGDGSADLDAARQQIVDLRAAVDRLRDEKDAELGRLETGAIQAMETTMTQSSRRIRDLEEELGRARATLRRQEDDLTTQRAQTVRLTAELRDRDRRIAALSTPHPPDADPGTAPAEGS